MNKPMQLLLAVILGVLGGIIVAVLLVVLNQMTLAHADSTMFFFNVGQGGAGGRWWASGFFQFPRLHASLQQPICGSHPMRILWTFLVLLLSIGTALAADNAIVLTPGVGVTERSVDIGGGVQAPGVVPVGTNGTAAWGTAGTANANVLTVQGVASMTPFLANPTAWGTATLGAGCHGGLARAHLPGRLTQVLVCGAERRLGPLQRGVLHLRVMWRV